MDFAVTDTNGLEQGFLNHCGVNITVGSENDFEIKIQNSLYDPKIHGKNCRFFCQDTNKCFSSGYRSQTEFFFFEYH